MDTAHLDSGFHTDLTERIVGCAIEVHDHAGPGLTESVYESAMCIELKTASLPFTRQLGVPVSCSAHCSPSIARTWLSATQ